LRYLVGIRRLAEFAAVDAILLIDNCWAHAIEDMIRLLTQERARVIIIPGQTTEIFQVLELTRVGVIERRSRSALPFVNDNAIV
jgi:stalled ribosome rescue protein Dom34